jgi:hypothetical protein
VSKKHYLQTSNDSLLLFYDEISVYTVEEKVKFVTSFLQDCSSREIRDNFAVEFPNRPIPSKSTILKVYNDFVTNGCVNCEHNKRQRRCRVLSQMARRLNVSTSTCYKGLKKEKFRSHKIRNVQKLLERDYLPRMEFCELWIDKINENPNIQNYLFFTDEKIFTLDGKVYRQNCRIWARENPYVIDEVHTQWPQKLNVWLGVISNHLIGPFFIDGPLNGQKYLDLLREHVLPALEDIRPLHQITREITNFLNQNFPRGWIGRYGTFKWPPRSPDLTSLDFYLWAYIAQKIFDNVRNKPETLEELKNRITEACRFITVRQLQNVRRNFYDRLGYCLAAYERQFEQFM